MEGIRRKQGEAPSPSRRSAYWQFTLFPDAREGAAVFVSVARDARTGRGREQSELVAARRARTQLRRYCVSNGLNRLGTLTYAVACRDEVRFRADLGGFFRAMRRRLGGRRFPYVWVPEWHPGGHGLHAHFAVGRFIPYGLLRESWAHGFPHIKLLGDLPVGSGAVAESRLAARYLTKYVTKSLGAQHVRGMHRYEVGQGFAPMRIAFRGFSFSAVLAEAQATMGLLPSTVTR